MSESGKKTQNEEILRVENLKVYYPAGKKSLMKKPAFVKAVDDISFTVYKGETFGVVGESGCGKTTMGRAVVQLIQPTGGRLWLSGQPLIGIRREDRLALAKKVQIIFQDSFGTLDPRFTIGRTIGEPLLIHGWGTEIERRERVLRLMNDVGLSKDCYDRFPHEFSGGQRQRVGTAKALALNPKLIVCDEPVSALDMSIQAQVVNLMKNLQKEYGLTYIFISHNLSVVKHICDRLAVMYLGHIVEMGDKKTLFNEPLHPYTKGLLEAIPIPDPEVRGMEEVLEGDVPSPINPPPGCVFHTRCKIAENRCRKDLPQLQEIQPGHFVACHFL